MASMRNIRILEYTFGYVLVRVYLSFREVVPAGAQTAVAVEALLAAALAARRSIQRRVPQRAVGARLAAHFHRTRSSCCFGAGGHQRDGDDNEAQEQH